VAGLSWGEGSFSEALQRQAKTIFVASLCRLFSFAYKTFITQLLNSINTLELWRLRLDRTIFGASGQEVAYGRYSLARWLHSRG
jgi:hypothetical protein